jgi:hypothetical protein
VLLNKERREGGGERERERETETERKSMQKTNKLIQFSTIYMYIHCTSCKCITYMYNKPTCILKRVRARVPTPKNDVTTRGIPCVTYSTRTLSLSTPRQIYTEKKKTFLYISSWKSVSE